MERLMKHPTYDQQEMLLDRFCSEAESLISAAGSRDEAVSIKDQLCTQFEKECGSSIVISGTRTFANQVIERIWGGKDTRGQNHSRKSD